LPLLELPTKLLSITCEGISAGNLEKRLRSSTIPVLGRVRNEAFLLDLRTILQPDIATIIAALQAVTAHETQA
jgi:L-seryl-tRNA(Ser) seleniumtransferase